MIEMMTRETKQEYYEKNQDIIDAKRCAEKNQHANNDFGFPHFAAVYYHTKNVTIAVAATVPKTEEASQRGIGQFG
jgi:hypothetical protein